jgi:hypothetical protein
MAQPDSAGKLIRAEIPRSGAQAEPQAAKIDSISPICQSHYKLLRIPSRRQKFRLNHYDAYSNPNNIKH